LDLKNNSLSGTLPPQLSSLDATLQGSLTASDNRISGTVPSTYGRLTSLSQSLCAAAPYHPVCHRLSGAAP
jgi:hypothetical protein